jgi:predicted cupin superfamily sugar epimerase
MLTLRLRKGQGVPVADDAAALRLAQERYAESDEQVVVVDSEGAVRYARRDPDGRFVGFEARGATAEALDLLPHPEGGWYRQTWAAASTVSPPGYEGQRPTGTAIYFLLQPGESSRWHRVRSDELYLWHRGGPLVLTLGGRAPIPAAPTTLLLGPNLAAGQQPQLLIPGGTWQTSVPAGADEVLISCVVSPGFDFADFSVV